MPDETNSDLSNLFPAGSQKRVERVLKRAADKAAIEAKQRMERAGGSIGLRKLGNTSAGDFERWLLMALKHHAANTRQQPSIRMVAPDTGGRSFHFDHTAVSKGTIDLAPGDKRKGRRERSRDKRHTSRVAAHLVYLERDGVAESLESDLNQSAEVKAGYDGHERSPSEMQAYLEDPEKEPGKPISGRSALPADSHFGTLGDTLEERIAFWNLAEEHSRGETGTIQHRLILELPHEASPADRLRIVKKFTDIFRDEERPVPFHAVLHAPTAANDQRNYHAHVVFLGRPAKQIPWPEGGKHYKKVDGPEVLTWDFAATEFKRNKFRKLVTTYPERQSVKHDGKAFFYLKDYRKRFADIVNEVMAAAGSSVRYDHRSYQEMGLQVEAMRSISRIVTDKAKRGDRVVLEAGQVKRAVQAEIARLAREREPELREIARIRAAVRSGQAELAKLERESMFMGRKPIIRRAGRALKIAIKAIALDYAVKRQTHIERKVDHAHQILTLERMIEACDPTKIGHFEKRLKDRLRSAKDNGRDEEVERVDAEVASMPSAEAAAVLKEAAVEQLAQARKEHAQSERLSLMRLDATLQRWRDAAIGKREPVLGGAPWPTDVAGIRLPSTGVADVKEAKTKHKPMFFGVESVIDEIFTTPFSRVMLDVYKRMGSFIMENSDMDVPGRTPIDLAKQLSAAFEKSPIEAERLMWEARHKTVSREALHELPPLLRPVTQSGSPVSSRGQDRPKATTAVAPVLSQANDAAPKRPEPEQIAPAPAVNLLRRRVDGNVERDATNTPASGGAQVADEATCSLPTTAKAAPLLGSNLGATDPTLLTEAELKEREAKRKRARRKARIMQQDRGPSR